MTSALPYRGRRGHPDARSARAETVTWLFVWFVIAAGGACMIAAASVGSRAAMAEPAAVPAAAASEPSASVPVRGAVTPPAAPLAAVMPDQHFRGCNAARAAGRTDIPLWDPSYREWMDGDHDGFACEPHRYD